MYDEVKVRVPHGSLDPVTLVATINCPPAEFLAALEQLREDYDEVKIDWAYGGTKPQITYVDGEIRVLLQGPELEEREVALPGAETRLREVAAQ